MIIIDQSQPLYNLNIARSFKPPFISITALFTLQIEPSLINKQE